MRTRTRTTRPFLSKMAIFVMLGAVAASCSAEDDASETIVQAAVVEQEPATATSIGDGNAADGGEGAADVRTVALEEEAAFYDVDLSDETWACIEDESILDVELDGASQSYLHYVALQRCASTELTAGVVAQAAESPKFTDESLDLLGCVYDGFAEVQAQYSVEELLARSQLRGTAEGTANEDDANEAVAALCDVLVLDVNAVLALQR